MQVKDVLNTEGEIVERTHLNECIIFTVISWNMNI